MGNTNRWLAALTVSCVLLRAGASQGKNSEPASTLRARWAGPNPSHGRTPMAKKADDESSPIGVQRKVEPAFRLPSIGSLPSLRFSLPLEEIERQRRQVKGLRRFEERLPKMDPAEAARLAEGRRLLDRDMAIADGLIAPPWLERLIKQLTERAPPAAPPPSEPKTDAPIESSSTESRADAEQRSQKNERQSRHRVRYAGAASKRALAVLKRMYPGHAYPTKSEVSDTDLWESFVEEWSSVEGAKGLSLNLRPSRSTVLRMVGRKD